MINNIIIKNILKQLYDIYIKSKYIIIIKHEKIILKI